MMPTSCSHRPHNVFHDLYIKSNEYRRGGTDGFILTENEITKYKSYNSYSQITSSPYTPYTHNFLQQKEFLLLIANDPNKQCVLKGFN